MSEVSGSNLFGPEAQVYDSTIFDENDLEDEGPPCGFKQRCNKVAKWRCNKESCGAKGCGILFCDDHGAYFREDQDYFDACFQCKSKFDSCCEIF